MNLLTHFKKTPLLKFKQSRRLSAFVIPLLFVCFALFPKAQAVSPAPDGGYPGANTAEGQNALLGLDTSTGFANTAVGWFSLKSVTAGGFNTATGAGALFANTADQNTAMGAAALFGNTTGPYNTATGSLALFSNTEGSGNTAVGRAALFANTTGGGNTAVGIDALSNNTADNNTAVGAGALLFNTTGENNTAMGQHTLFANTEGDLNTAVGFQALALNTAGVGNTAIGYASLYNSTGSYNIALTGGFNLTAGDFNIYVGNDGEANESGTIRIGSSCCQTRAFVSGIWGANPGNGTAVYVNSAGQLYTPGLSAVRFKNEIKPMDKASEGIFMLKPVTFHYKSDNTNTPQFGLIAEEVAAVNPDLVARDEKGELYIVRYEAVNAMLLNEFLKEHRKVQQLEANAARQQQQIDVLSAGLQRVSAQLERSKPAPQIVANDR
jgi:hypothetical protein